MPELITILGPTATGKTRLAAQLADKLNGEIISADSRQIYRGMDIGTGKDLDDYLIDGKQITTHLVDIADPGYEYNVFEFQKDFFNAYKKIISQKKQPILCGGTGLYLEAVLSGYRLCDVPENTNLRKKIQHLSQNELIAILKSYGKVHNTTDILDRERTLRAIEIKHYQEAFPDKTVFPTFNSLNIGIRFERNIVRQRITQRLKKRLETGMIEEVKQLLNSGLIPEQLIFYGLEYRFVTQYVIGKISYEEMFNSLKIAIHQFSKRQMTWFRRMEKRGIVIRWIDGMLPINEKIKVCLHLLPQAGR